MKPGIPLRASQLRVVLPNLLGGFYRSNQRGRFDPGLNSFGRERVDHNLRRNVTHKIVARKRASAKSGESGIEPVAAGLVSCQYLLCRSLRTAVQVDSELKPGGRAFHGL